MNIIIYGSQYGTSKQYAEELSRRIGYDLLSYEKVGDLGEHETIVYIGSLYAGGVLGMKKTFAALKDVQYKRIIIITVGLADPSDKENTDSIRQSLQRQLSQEIYDRAQIYHLRGGIDYSRLNFKHKTMMGLLYKKAVSLPEEKKTAEVKAMIETYNKKVSFVDHNSLDPIIYTKNSFVRSELF